MTTFPPPKKRAIAQAHGRVQLRGDTQTGEILRAAFQRAARKNSNTLTHEIHSYPARMHPAIARTLIQKSEGVVLDPFCGSGTVLVESLVASRDALGSDLNPLGLELARLKTRVLSDDDLEKLKAQAEAVMLANKVRVKEKRKALAPLRMSSSPRPLMAAPMTTSTITPCVCPGSDSTMMISIKKKSVPAGAFRKAMLEFDGEVLGMMNAMAHMLKSGQRAYLMLGDGVMGETLLDADEQIERLAASSGFQHIATASEDRAPYRGVYRREHIIALERTDKAAYVPKRKRGKESPYERKAQRREPRQDNDYKRDNKRPYKGKPSSKAKSHERSPHERGRSRTPDEERAPSEKKSAGFKPKQFKEVTPPPRYKKKKK